MTFYLVLEAFDEERNCGSKKKTSLLPIPLFLFKKQKNLNITKVLLIKK